MGHNKLWAHVTRTSCVDRRCPEPSRPELVLPVRRGYGSRSNTRSGSGRVNWKVGVSQLVEVNLFSVHLHYRNDLCCQTKKTVTNLSTPLVTFPPQLLFFHSLCHSLGLILDNYTPPFPPNLCGDPVFFSSEGAGHIYWQMMVGGLSLSARACVRASAKGGGSVC